MGRKNWPRGVTAPNISKPPSLFSINHFEFNNEPPPSNNLYPDANPQTNNAFQSAKDASYDSGNLPPWQRNRGGFRSNQDQNIDSAPWNEDSRLESQTAHRSAWKNDQGASYNSSISDSNFGGRYDQGNEIFLREPQLSNYKDNRAGGSNTTNRWSDREMSNERREMNRTPSHSKDYYQTFPASNPDRFDASRSEEWSNQPSSSRNQSSQFGKPVSQNPDWDDVPRHEEWCNKNYIQPIYNKPIQQGPQWEGNQREQDWSNRQESSWRNEWNAEQPNHDDRWMSSQDRMKDSRKSEWPGRTNQGLSERNWNENLRNQNDPGWAREPQNDNTNWSNERDLMRSSRSGDILDSRDQNLNANRDFYEGPSDRRAYGRKRERSPVNPNVWSRLETEPKFSDNFRETIKKFKVAGDMIINNQKSKDVLRYESLDSQSQGPVPLFSSIKPAPADYDLRSHLLGVRSSLPRKPADVNSYDVLICPKVKKSRFLPKDMTEIKEKLVKTLYQLAESSDVSNIPQLRFKDIKMENRTRIAVSCQDAATATWLLGWKLGRTRFPMRIVLPEDLSQLAIIGLLVKNACEFNVFEMKLNLKTQNPGLDVSKWVNGVAVKKKKGLSFTYQVDGHTLRYLVKNKWELFIGMQKLRVNRLKTNFNFNASSYARL